VAVVLLVMVLGRHQAGIGPTATRAIAEIGDERLGSTSENNEKYGGETGIRTLGPREGTTVFETAPFDHSGTSPRS
jgi:hypothetical protein